MAERNKNNDKMSSICLNPNDITLLSSKIDLHKIEFLRRHLDAFLTFYEEQGKTFWLRYLISFREYLYEYILVENGSRSKLCKHYIAYICDDAFFMLHKELVECSKTKKVKKFLFDLTIVVALYISYPNICQINLNKSPFNRSENKSALNRILGFSTKNSHPTYKGFCDAFVAPIFIILSGNLYNMMQHWKTEKTNSSTNVSSNYHWICPLEWSRQSFKPNRFDRYITCFYGDNLELELGFPNAASKVLNFPDRAKEPKSEFIDKNYTVLNCDCVNDMHIVNAFKRCVVFKNEGIKGQRPCLHTDEDINNIEYVTGIDSQIDDLLLKLVDINCPVCHEEAKKSLLFKLAENQFKEEETQFKKEETKIKQEEKDLKPKSKKNKKKKPKAAVAVAVASELEGAVGFQKDIAKILENNIEVHVNVTDREDTDLMLKTSDNMLKEPVKATEKLISPTKFENVPAQRDKALSQSLSPIEFEFQIPFTVRTCWNCRKSKENGIKLKKCALCVAEKVTKIRYYCGRECQGEDWLKCHKDEHETNLLPKSSF